jgi:hypothetical protein
MRQAVRTQRGMRRQVALLPRCPPPPPILHTLDASRSADRDMLKLTQQEFEQLPLQLSFEVLAGAALALVGGYGLAGALKPIVVSTGV